MVATLLTIAADNPGETLILFGAADWFVEAIARNRKRLEGAYVIPYPDAATIARATDKVAFGEAADRLGVPYPETTVVDLSLPLGDLSGLPYPVVAKAASTSEFHGSSSRARRRCTTPTTRRLWPRNWGRPAQPVTRGLPRPAEGRRRGRPHEGRDVFRGSRGSGARGCGQGPPRGAHAGCARQSGRHPR